LCICAGPAAGRQHGQAATVIFDPEVPTKAIGIRNLEYEGNFYNVAFTPTGTVAADVYDEFPGQFDFNTSTIAKEVVGQVKDELNKAGATGVGAEGSVAVPFYWIGFESKTGLDRPKLVFYQSGAYNEGTAQWVVSGGDPYLGLYDWGTGVWAKFTETSEEPVTIGGTVTGLQGRGLVLQNNGGDDLPIDADGPFTFATTLEAGIRYNVTVLTNPTSPAQECVVENGSGTVPTENVTDVVVSCAEPILVDNLAKVAAEGDTLPDDTVLTTILLDGGVAISIEGQVAFGGKDDAGIDAAFTQAGLVVAEGDLLDDGTTLAAFRGQGEVAISAGSLGDMVAFHGQAENGENDIAAVFTQAGQVAAVGDFIDQNIFLGDIDPEGKVAINNFYHEVAFHGKLSSGRRVVFISDGETTQVAIFAGKVFNDGIEITEITESGGVAINDFAEVSFHGRTEGLRAVFTQNGLVAKVGTDLPDNTVLDDINENGGVAINAVGEVAFHGQIGDVKAVFISDGVTTQVVAKVGDKLDDGTLLEDIEVSGGVAINLFGEVAFHGRTGGLRAVFTQNGLVAREISNLPDGNTLSEISANAGVAINPYGFEVAFHGRIGTTDAVFVGQVPLDPFAVPAAEDEEWSNE
jgi:hypothetical protein